MLELRTLIENFAHLAYLLVLYYLPRRLSSELHYIFVFVIQYFY
jgi:hypothetical protein